MAINPSIGLIAFARQTDRDTPATTPTFVHGLTGGSPFSASRSIANTPVACGTRAPSDARVDSIEVGASVESLCYPDAVGLYLYAALGKVTSAAADGKAGYFKHVFEMGDALPYMTFWSQVGTNNFTRTDGCKCSSLEFSATGNEHLAMKGSFLGTDGKVGIDRIPGNTEASCYNGKYTTTDCEFKLDTASKTPSEALVSEASFTITNGTKGLTSLGRVTPRDIADGNLSAGCSVTTIPDDITQYRKMVTGSATSTDITGKVVLGSVCARFQHTDDPNMTIEFELANVPFTADYPSVDPEGAEGTIQFSCDAAIISQAGQSPIKVTVVNKVNNYNGVNTASARAATATK